MLQYAIAFSLTVPFFLPEQHIELSPGQTCCKISSFKDAQDSNSLEMEHLHDLPQPRKLEILILCKVNKSKGIFHKHTNIPPHHLLHKSIRNLTSGRAWPSSRLLLSPSGSTFIFFVLRSPLLPSSPLNPRSYHPPPPASSTSGCQDRGSSKVSY